MGYGPVFFPWWESGPGGYKETRNILSHGLSAIIDTTTTLLYQNRKMWNRLRCAEEAWGESVTVYYVSGFLTVDVGFIV